MAAFASVTRHTVVDTGFSVDLGRFSDVAFVDPHTLVVIGENKSYVTLRENDRADALRNYRFFLESADRFDEVSRSRLSTVRARMAYTMSLAFDPDTQSLFTVSVPNDTVRRLVVSRFDRGDMTLSEEFLPCPVRDERTSAPREEPLAGRALRDGSDGPRSGCCSR